MILSLIGYYCSGKSLVANLFQNYSFQIWDLDLLIFPIFEKKKDQILSYFGSSIIDEHSKQEIIISRKKLAKEVFENPFKLKILENILYPDFEKYLQQRLSQVISNEKLIIVSAVLYKLPMIQKKIEFTIFLKTPINRIILWALKRDGINKKEVLQRLYAQKSLGIALEKVNFLIKNNKNIYDLKNQVEKCINLINFHMKTLS